MPPHGCVAEDVAADRSQLRRLARVGHLHVCTSLAQRRRLHAVLGRGGDPCDAARLWTSGCGRLGRRQVPPERVAAAAQGVDPVVETGHARAQQLENLRARLQFGRAAGGARQQQPNLLGGQPSFAAARAPASSSSRRTRRSADTRCRSCSGSAGPALRSSAAARPTPRSHAPVRRSARPALTFLSVATSTMLS